MKWRLTRVNGLPDAIVASDPDLGSVPIAKIVLGTVDVFALKRKIEGAA